MKEQGLQDQGRGGKNERETEYAQTGSKISKNFHVSTEQWYSLGAIPLTPTPGLPGHIWQCPEMFLVVMIEGWRVRVLLASRSC